jgi:Sortase and related acyltransferases
MENIEIKTITAEAWPEVAKIYTQGIATRNATFQQKAPEWEEWDAAHRPDCRLMAVLEDKVVGWAALSKVSGRCVYSGVAEVSIYIDEQFRGQGIGNVLMEALIDESEKNGIWTLQAGIFPENKASIRLHESQGFRVIGIREKLGQMDGNWRNVAMLERRSKVVGNGKSPCKRK